MSGHKKWRDIRHKATGDQVTIAELLTRVDVLESRADEVDSELQSSGRLFNRVGDRLGVIESRLDSQRDQIAALGESMQELAEDAQMTEEETARMRAAQGVSTLGRDGEEAWIEFERLLAGTTGQARFFTQLMPPLPESGVAVLANPDNRFDLAYVSSEEVLSTAPPRAAIEESWQIVAVFPADLWRRIIAVSLEHIADSIR